MNTSEHVSDEAYCISCKARVTFEVKRRFFNFIYGQCPKGHNVAKLILGHTNPNEPAVIYYEKMPK